MDELDSTANTTKFDPTQAELIALPTWWILRSSIQDFMQNIFETLWSLVERVCKFSPRTVYEWIHVYFVQSE